MPVLVGGGGCLFFNKYKITGKFQTDTMAVIKDCPLDRVGHYVGFDCIYSYLSDSDWSVSLSVSDVSVSLYLCH